MDRLQQLIEEGVIDEVFNQLKTGKEAEVWLVSHRGEPVAAKIYKAREFRSFKNDADYKEGRQVRNSRTQRAMDKGSKFGRAAAEEAWKSAEADVMFTLHAAGVRVPKPVLFYDGVLLMEVIGDAEGRVAPRLVEADIKREHAEPLYLLLRAEIIKILSEDLIHGDLSEFNILLGANGPVIIDFPQVVTAAKNSNSERYFRRDLGNLLRFFSSIDPQVSKHQGDVDEIWREYVRRDLSPHFVPSGRVHHPPRSHDSRRGPFRDGQQGPGQQRAPFRDGQQGPGQERGPGQQRTAQGPRNPGQQRGFGAQGARTQQPGDAPGNTGQPRPRHFQSPRGERSQAQLGQQHLRRGPEVSIKGQPSARSESQRGGEPRRNSGGGGRRRPPRRF